MPTHTDIQFTADLQPFANLPQVLVIGRKQRLADPRLRDAVGIDESTWNAMLDDCDPGDEGSSVETRAGTRRVILGALPDACSRHNSPSRAWAIPSLVETVANQKDAGVILALESGEMALASALAVARGLPLFDQHSGERNTRTVTLAALGPDGPPEELRAPAALDAVRLACRLFDTPTAELHTDAFVEEARAVAEEVGAAITVIRGEELRDGGFGGLWNVGKAAEHPPALVALVHEPEGASRTVAWVGKGMVYDTGGLSLKVGGHMATMKGDMGGAAAVLGAFKAAVQSGFPHKLVAVLCLAENAIGPKSYRPDDIITCYSGKTVEVNNTDAEGRLVLADGVAWACAEHKPEVLVDVATLTGAALIATGKTHAGIYSNDEELERMAIECGQRVGEPVHPFVYAPELFRKEFKSKVADMKNSVKDRMNAQSSCAGQFVGNHLPEDDPPRWLHVDIAGPAWTGNDRGSGFGVGLLLELATALS
ncbi:MAG: leucyl aminopeptidase family protein [Deltaproteobacteria bacterium]|nr:MAG: leucyl aminopeptidase family protein [Deltaproteobacteria bacterium]